MHSGVPSYLQKKSEEPPFKAVFNYPVVWRTANKPELQKCEWGYHLAFCCGLVSVQAQVVLIGEESDRFTYEN